MDVSPRDNCSLEGKSTMSAEQVDEVAACFGEITLTDKRLSDGDKRSPNKEDITYLQIGKIVEDKQSHKGEEVEGNVEVHGNQSNELHEEVVSIVEESIEGDVNKGEKVEGNIEVCGSQSNELHKEVASLVEKSIDENVTQSSKTDTNKTSKKENNLKGLLQTLQCPFNWKWEMNDNSEYFLSRIIKKIEETEEEGTFPWRHFLLSLLLCCEYYHKKDIDSAYAELRRCEAIVNSSDSKGDFESFFQSTRNALLHTVLSCKCYLYLEKGDLNEVEKILDKICKEEDMDNSCKAAIWGIKAGLSMEYGFEGNKVALDYVKKALELDKEQAEWHFLHGKCLGRLRRIDHYTHIPAHEELKALEEAVKLLRITPYIVFLAQSYREAAFRVFSLNKSKMESLLKSKIDNMNQRSYDLYREALCKEGDCSHVNIRCAQGFYKLPAPFKDLKEAKRCCDKALQLAPENAMAHHIRGQIYQHDGDYDNAKKHLKKAGELGAFGAFMDLHKLEYELDSSYNPILHFENMLKQFTEKPRREETLSQMGSYYYFLKDDISTAFRKYWLQVIEDNPESNKLKEHKCIFLSMQKPVNIYDLLHDEALIALQDSRSGEDVKLLQEIVCLCVDLFPELESRSPKPRRKMILEESYNAKSYNKNKNRNRGRVQGSQGNQWRRERNEDYNRNRNEGSGRGRGNSRSHDSSTRFIPRNTDSRPREPFNRRRYESNWRTNRDD